MKKKKMLLDFLPLFGMLFFALKRNKVSSSSDYIKLMMKGRW